jgi:hypothetical protein
MRHHAECFPQIAAQELRFSDNSLVNQSTEKESMLRMPMPPERE